MAKGSMPVLVGVGQSLSQWDGSAGLTGAPSPLSLMVEASRSALADTGGAGIAGAIDTIAVVRIFEDSVRNAPHPHGHNTNLPGTLARDIGASPARLIERPSWYRARVLSGSSSTAFTRCGTACGNWPSAT